MVACYLLYKWHKRHTLGSDLSGGLASGQCDLQWSAQNMSRFSAEDPTLLAPVDCITLASELMQDDKTAKYSTDF